MQSHSFEAYITVDGVKLPHYEVKVDEGAKTATCWIPSEAGKCFAINWRPLEPHPFDARGDIYIDGVGIGGKLHRKNMTVLASKDDTITSPTTTRPLLFASIQLTDDDAYLNSAVIKDLGDIVLRISQVEVTGTQELPRVDPIMNEKVHERSKKAMVHRAKFGEETVRRDTALAAMTKDIATLMTFSFKYRSIDVLRADGIAPPDPIMQSQGGRKRKAGERDGASDDDENDRPEDDAGQEDEATLKAQLRLIQAKLAKRLKSKKVKTEPKPRFILGEIIDLT